MRKTIRNGLVIAATAAATVGLTTVPANADHYTGTWTVTGATGTATGTSTNTVLSVPRSGATLSCALSVAHANISNQTGGSGEPVGTIHGSDWTDCTLLGIGFQVTHVGDWDLNVIDPDEDGDPNTPDDPNIAVGTITNVEATISGPLCNATITGGVPGTYNNNTGVLSVDPAAYNPHNVQLTASNASCVGAIQNGDHPEFDGDFTIDPSTIDITTP